MTAVPPLPPDSQEMRRRLVVPQLAQPVEAFPTPAQALRLTTEEVVYPLYFAFAQAPKKTHCPGNLRMCVDGDSCLGGYPWQLCCNCNAQNCGLGMSAGEATLWTRNAVRKQKDFNRFKADYLKRRKANFGAFCEQEYEPELDSATFALLGGIEQEAQTKKNEAEKKKKEEQVGNCICGTICCIGCIYICSNMR